MTQRLNSDFNIDPLSTNGEELAAILNRMIASLDTTNAGATPPAYKQQGMLWVDSSGVSAVPSIMKLMMNNGVSDILVATFDMTNNTIAYSGVDLSKIMHTNAAQVMTEAISGIAPTLGAHLTRKDYVDLGATPIGGIIMYSGAYADVPSNWSICDGRGTTPDLTDKFIYGASDESEIGDEGGSADAAIVSHDHNGTFTGDNITGTIETGSKQDVVYASGVFKKSTGRAAMRGGSYETGGNGKLSLNHKPTGAVNIDDANHAVPGTGKNLPPYYKLAYIRRMT